MSIITLTIDFTNNNKHILSVDLTKKLDDYKDAISKFTGFHLDSYRIVTNKMKQIDWNYSINNFEENDVIFFLHKLR